MADVDGGSLVAKALRADGVKYIFVLWGFHVAPIIEGCECEGRSRDDTRELGEGQ